MRVLLVDLDSKIPNLALMKLSAYYKARGDAVGLDLTAPDRVYVACVFQKNAEQAHGLRHFFPGAEIVLGGSGVNYDRLPDEVEQLPPDYSLYNGKVCQRCGCLVRGCGCMKRPTPGDLYYSMGFTTRGCVRRCSFCIVPQKEGALTRWQHPREFHDPRHKVIRLLDNNWLADRPWFFETSGWLAERGLRVIEGGLDIRLIDRKNAERLAAMKWGKPIHFAFDNMNDEKAVRKGCAILEAAGVDLRHSALFYVLVEYGTTPAEDVYRCWVLKELGATPYIMPYTRTPWAAELMWWANKPQRFWAFDIAEARRKNKIWQEPVEGQTTLEGTGEP